MKAVAGAFSRLSAAVSVGIGCLSWRGGCQRGMQKHVATLVDTGLRCNCRHARQHVGFI